MATDVAGNLKRVVQSLPPHVRLVAVSKFHPNEELMAAYEQGQRIFGESQEQELSRKAAELPKDIAWHFIGHLKRWTACGFCARLTSKQRSAAALSTCYLNCM